MPYDEYGDWYQDEIEVNGEQPLSPWEQEFNNGEPYDPNYIGDTPGPWAGAFVPYPADTLTESTGPGLLPPDPSEPAPAPSAPAPTYSGASSGGSSGGNGGSLLEPFQGTYQRPDMRSVVQEALGLLPARPEFNAPEIPQINPWAQPKWDDIYQDQSYLGRKKEGEQALMNSKAAQGLARTGGTLKDLLAYNQDFAGREFGNIANRSLEGWRANTDATLRRSGMEQDRARSMYEPQFAEYQNKVNTVARAQPQALDQSWREFLTDVDLWRDQRDSTFDKLSWLSGFDRDSAAL